MADLDQELQALSAAYGAAREEYDRRQLVAETLYEALEAQRSARAGKRAISVAEALYLRAKAEADAAWQRRWEASAAEQRALLAWYRAIRPHVPQTSQALIDAYLERHKDD